MPVTNQRILTLGRIIIFGLKVDKLKSFYVDNFGLSVVEEIPGQWIVLNAGAVEVAIHRIGQGYEPKGGEEFRAEGNVKLVFHVSSGLPELRQRLLDNGVAIGEIKSFTGITSLFCDGEDPEGNVFQLEQKL